MKNHRLVAMAVAVTVVLASGLTSASTASTSGAPPSKTFDLSQMLGPSGAKALDRLLAETSRPLSTDERAVLRNQLTAQGIERDLLSGLSRARELASAHRITLGELDISKYETMIKSHSFAVQLQTYLNSVDKDAGSRSYAAFFNILLGIPNPFGLLGPFVTALAGLAAGICIALEPCGADATILDVLVAAGATIGAEVTLVGEKYNQEQGVTPGGSGACTSRANIIGEVQNGGPEIEYTGSFSCGFAVSAQLVVTLYIDSEARQGQYDAVALSCSRCTSLSITPNQFVPAENPACYQAVTDVSGTDSFGDPFNLASSYSSVKCFKS